MNHSLTFKIIAIICFSILNLGIWAPKLISTSDTTLVLVGALLVVVNVYYLALKFGPILYYIIQTTTKKDK